MPISVSEWRVRIGRFIRRQTEIPQDTINVEDVNAALRSQQACGKAPVDDQRTDAIHVPVTRDYKRTRKDKSSWSKRCGSHPTQNHTHVFVNCDPCPISRAKHKCFFGSTSPLLEMFVRTINRYDYFNTTSNQSAAHNTPLKVNDVSHRYRSLLLAVIGMLSELYIAGTKLMRAGDIETNPGPKELDGKRDAVVNYVPSIVSNIPPVYHAPLERELGIDGNYIPSLPIPSDGARLLLEQPIDSWIKTKNWDEETAQKILAMKVRSIEIQHGADKQKGDDSARYIETKPVPKEPTKKGDAVVHYVPSIVSNIPPEYYAPLGRELGFDEQTISSLSPASDGARQLLERLIDSWLKKNSWDEEDAKTIFSIKVRSIEIQHGADKQKGDDSARYIDTKPVPKEPYEKKDAVVHYVPSIVSNIPSEYYAPLGRELGFDEKIISSLSPPSGGARCSLERPIDSSLKEIKMDEETAPKAIATELDNRVPIETYERSDHFINPLRYRVLEHQHEMDKQTEDSLSNERLYDTMEHITTIGYWRVIDILKDQFESATHRVKYKIKAQIINHLKSKGSRDPAFQETAIIYNINDVHKTWDLLLTKNITKPSLSSDEAFFNYICAILQNSKISENNPNAAWEIISLSTNSDEGSSTKRYESNIDPANLDHLPYLVNLTSTDALASYTCVLLERYRYYEVLTFEASDALSIDSSSPTIFLQDTYKMQKESSSTSSSDEIFLAACSNQCRLQRECVAGLFERKAVEDKLREMKDSALTEIHLTAILDVEISPNFTVRKCRHMLMDRYKATVCKVHKLPHDKSRLASVEDVYTTLTLCKLENQRVHVPNSVEGIFATEFNGKIPSRICLFADAGKGKSTAVAKLAYDWVSRTSGSTLANLPLLFVIKLCSLAKHTSLEQTIVSDLLDNYEGITHEGLKVFIEENQKFCWFIFDGLDAYAGKNDVSPEISNNVVQVITNQMLHQCRVLVTGRSYIDTYFDQGYLHYTYGKMEIEGYSPKRADSYIDGFFVGATSDASQLKCHIIRKTTLKELVRTPLFCEMICHLWWSNRAILDYEYVLFDQINGCLWNHFILKRPAMNSGLTLSNILIKLGEMALNKILHDPNSFCFTPIEFSKHENILKFGLEVGIISSKRDTTGEIRSVNFYNKLIRDHSAAQFIVMKTTDMFLIFKQTFLDKILKKLEKRGLTKFKDLIRFIACSRESLCLQVLEFTMHSRTLGRGHKYCLLLDCLSEVKKPGDKLLSFVQRSFMNNQIVLKSPTVYTATGLLNLPEQAMHEIHELFLDKPQLDADQTNYLWEGLKSFQHLSHLIISGLPPLKNSKLALLPSVKTLEISSSDLHSYASLMNSLCNVQDICIYVGNLANELNNIVSLLTMARQGKDLSITMDGTNVQRGTTMRTSFDMSRELQECTDVTVTRIRLRNFTDDEAHLVFLVKCLSSLKSLREIRIFKCSMKDDGPLISYLKGQNTRSNRYTFTVVVTNQETLEYIIQKRRDTYL